MSVAFAQDKLSRYFTHVSKKAPLEDSRQLYVYDTASVRTVSCLVLQSAAAVSLCVVMMAYACVRSTQRTGCVGGDGGGAARQAKAGGEGKVEEPRAVVFLWRPTLASQGVLSKWRSRQGHPGGRIADRRKSLVASSQLGVAAAAVDSIGRESAAAAETRVPENSARAAASPTGPDCLGLGAGPGRCGPCPGQPIPHGIARSPLTHRECDWCRLAAVPGPGG